MEFYRSKEHKYWNVPYLPIDPKDIKRGYEKVIRVNSQSGKGGASFIISEFLGVNMSKDEAIKFGFFIKEESDRLKRELKKDEIIELYKNYLSK